MSAPVGDGFSTDTRRRWLPYRLLLLLCAVAAAAWALVGIWYGAFAGFVLLGEPNAYEEEVGRRQLYWAIAALIGAVVAAVFVAWRHQSGRRLFAAGALVIVSIALSLPGWHARDAARHPNTAPEIRAFRPPSGAQLVQQDLGSPDRNGVWTGLRIWQSNRLLTALCREVEREFERWASDVRRDPGEPCSFQGDRGPFSSFVNVDSATDWHRLAGERAVDPSQGRVAIRLAVIAS